LLGLGTVQFGMPYGMGSRSEVCSDEVKRVLGYAAQCEMQTIDTSCAYGSSEKKLGESDCLQHFNVITKTPTFSKDKINRKDAGYLRSAFSTSLKYLKKQSLTGLLAHSADDLLLDGSEYLFDEMLLLKQERKVKKIGVSVYTPEQLEKIMRRFPIDIVQLPLNLFDQRFLKNSMITALFKKGIEIHARSIFLQGVLLLDLHNLPVWFKQHENEFSRYASYLKNNGFSHLEACLGFVKSMKEVSVALVGVHTMDQLQEIISVYQNCDSVKMDFSFLANERESLIDPRGWQYG